MWEWGTNNYTWRACHVKGYPITCDLFGSAVIQCLRTLLPSTTHRPPPTTHHHLNTGSPTRQPLLLRQILKPRHIDGRPVNPFLVPTDGVDHHSVWHALV